MPLLDLSDSQADFLKQLLNSNLGATFWKNDQVADMQDMFDQLKDYDEGTT